MEALFTAHDPNGVKTPLEFICLSVIIRTINSRKPAGKHTPQETVQKGLKRSILQQTV